jgi:hypothetical protein
MVNLPHGPLGGVGVEDILGAGSLILTLPALLPTTFLNFFGGGGAAVAFRLLAWALDDLALGLVDESLVDSVLRARAKIGMAGITLSPLKPGMVEAKLSEACTIAYAENEYLRKKIINKWYVVLPSPPPLQDGRCAPARA